MMSQTPPDTRNARPARDAALGAWRRRRLAAAGFEPRLAAQLAAEPAVDLHELLVLVDSGCPPPLAARILAPLESVASQC